MSAKTLPRIAVTLGDPAGIGPEVVQAALCDPAVRSAARWVALGPRGAFPAAARETDRAGLARDLEGHTELWLDSGGPQQWDMGRVQASCGAASLAALRAGHELALERRVDALVTAPVSKEALHAAGERCEGQTELLGRWCGVTRFEMVAVARQLRVMLLTRHMPLRAALDLVRPERVLEHLELFDESLRAWGFARPRLALAGLNPHAGEGGLLGQEDERELAPAVRAARERGLDVQGPISPDAVFLAAARGRFDGVLALYHDQAFIPVKLHAPEEGLTVIAGLPYLRVSPAHGTAFDIAGQGRASARNMAAALLQAVAWCRRA